jgi:hypothetical protein
MANVVEIAKASMGKGKKKIWRRAPLRGQVKHRHRLTLAAGRALTSWCQRATLG